MIKISNGRECGEPIRIGTMPKLENICRALMELGARSGLPIDAQVDEVRIGRGLSAIGAPQYPCVVVYNREHRDSYFYHIFAVEKHMKEDYIQIYLGGSSVGGTAVATYERQDRGLFRDSLLAKAKRVQKYELIYQDRLLELVRPAFEMAAQMSDRQNREELLRKQAEDARRQREAEELRQKQTKAACHQQKQEHQPEQDHQPEKKKACRNPQETVSGTSSGLREASRGPAQAHREYIGGSREDCSSYRYRNGTMIWTSKTVEADRKAFSCRKCGKTYEIGKGRGSQRFCCNSCGHLIEVTC